jgi:hypothetical protein
MSADAEDRWVILEAGPGQRMTIASLGVELEVDAIYRGAIAS